MKYDHAFVRSLVFRSNGGRPITTGPAIGNRPVLALGQSFVGCKPVGPLPGGLLAEDRAQFLQARIDGTEAQFAGTAAFQGRIADIVIGAVDLVNAGCDVAPTGCIGSKTAQVHVPEIKLRFAIDNPSSDHLANSTRA